MHPILKKLTVATMSLLMLPTLFACGQTEGDLADTTNTTAETTVSEEERLYGDLPTDRFNGYEFNVLQYKETTAATATVLTEMTGNPIEDALYERMLAVEQRLDVKFVNNVNDLAETVTLLRNSITGGLDEYDVYWGHSTTTVSNFLAAGYLTDMNTVDALDFSKPWWDKTANENLALDKHMYMAFGDINIYLFDFHSTLVFNKDVTDQYGEDLYGMVQNGTWTVGEKGCLRLVGLSTESVAPVSVKTRRSSLPIISELSPSLFLEQAQSIRRTKGLTWDDCLKCFSLRQSFFQWSGFLFKWQTFLEFEGF